MAKTTDSIFKKGISTCDLIDGGIYKRIGYNTLYRLSMADGQFHSIGHSAPKLGPYEFELLQGVPLTNKIIREELFFSEGSNVAQFMKESVSLTEDSLSAEMIERGVELIDPKYQIRYWDMMMGKLSNVPGGWVCFVHELQQKYYGFNGKVLIYADKREVCKR